MDKDEIVAYMAQGQQELSKLLLSIVVTALLYGAGIDLFNVFKLYHKQQCHQEESSFGLLESSDMNILRHKTIQMEPDKWDRWRRPISKLLILFNTYVTIKVVFCTMFVPALSKQFACNKSTPSDLADKQLGAASGTRRLVCSLAMFAIEPAVSNLLKSFLTLMFLMATINRVYIMLSKESGTIDLGLLRLHIDPKRELARVSLLIDAVCERIRQSMLQFRSQMVRIVRLKHGADPGGVREDFSSLVFVMKLLEDDREQLAQMLANRHTELVPNIYKLHLFKQMRPILMWQLSQNCFGYIAFFVLYLVLVFATVIDNCGPNCRFGWYDIQLAAEVSLVCQLNGQPFAGPNIITGSAFYAIVRLLDGVELELQTCLDRLRQLRRRLLELTASAGSNAKVATKTTTTTTTTTKLARPAPPSDNKQFQPALLGIKLEANRVVFKTMAKILVYRHELTTNSDAMSYSVSIVLVSLLVMIYGELLIEAAKVDDVRVLRLTILPSCLLLANAFCLSCAHISARLANLTRHCWSIAAESLAIHREQHDSAQLWQATAGLGFGSIFWLRFVTGNEFWRARFVPRPGGLLITYRNILEMNFFIVSIITIFVLR